MEHGSNPRSTPPDPLETHAAILAVLAECHAELVGSIEDAQCRIETYAVGHRQMQIVRSFALDAENNGSLQEVSVCLPMMRVTATADLTNAIRVYLTA
jgi:hypothetical protein